MLFKRNHYHEIPLEAIEEVTERFSVKYSERVSVHHNALTNKLQAINNNEVRSLKRLLVSNLTRCLR